MWLLALWGLCCIALGACLGLLQRVWALEARVRRLEAKVALWRHSCDATHRLQMLMLDGRAQEYTTQEPREPW